MDRTGRASLTRRGWRRGDGPDGQSLPYEARVEEGRWTGQADPALFEEDGGGEGLKLPACRLGGFAGIRRRKEWPDEQTLPYRARMEEGRWTGRADLPLRGEDGGGEGLEAPACRLGGFAGIRRRKEWPDR